MSAPPVRLGTQGWNYADWVGPLYPAGTRPADFLRVYARAFSTVEVDSTFYAIPSARTVRGWTERTPPGFVLALKLPREVTHERRLRDARSVVDEFFDRARELGDRLGPVLVQLGPDFGVAERPALEAFLPLLPRDVRVAVEFRQREWISEPTWTLLREHGVALALSDGRWLPRRWLLELMRRPTADFHYLRWMGPDRSITEFSRVQVDRSDELAAWAEDAPAEGRGVRLREQPLRRPLARHRPRPPAPARPGTGRAGRAGGADLALLSRRPRRVRGAGAPAPPGGTRPRRRCG